MTKDPRTPGRRAAEPGDPGQGSGRKRGKRFYKSEVEREAFRQGMTVEEYGVYKGSVGSAVKPVNSAKGLLIIVILMSILIAPGIVFFIPAWLSFSAGDKVVIPIFCLVILWCYVMAWKMYLKERKAERLRKARGITLIRPEE